MADGQAVMAFAHGMNSPPLPWEQGKVVQPWEPATDGRTCRRCGKVNPAAQEDCPAGAEVPGAGTEPHDLVSSEFLAGVEAAARLIELHCCVSTCCDAQPGSSTAEELARCVRKNHGIGVCGHEKEHWRHIEERGELSLRRYATWCKQCGSLNDGTWQAPTGSRRAGP
jgi:hypothetical protein